ncbi:MAG: glycogen debranching protein GlgX, partial [Thermodesulfobacteriota bacterium]
PWDSGGSGHRFSDEHLLLDPYAKALTGSSDWGDLYRRQGDNSPPDTFRRRCCLVDDDFDWEGDRPLNLPLQDSIIYEMHVRGFTRHSSSGVARPGTYLGLVEKIPYLQELGITAVELLPVTEFNENENLNRNPVTGEQLKNFWGYSSLSFFAPKASYAVNGRNGKQVREFKEMVKALHKAGIEVILDIVFNHTAEGGADGPVFCFRGLDNTIYYMLDPETSSYLNFSGCGNTLNCNHPLVRKLIIDCLRYWVIEMHVDGFRFDLASILGRDSDGTVLENPPMIEKIAEDPILANTKIIAEAWDAAGLYQVGSFSSHPRWAEWNGHFRDDIRALMSGFGSVGAAATRISGSADLYEEDEKAPSNSINFITSHDGFTLYDLVSYDHKHNEANGEGNRDGSDLTHSWNSGVEGETDDPGIRSLRFRRIRTLAVILFLSQGTPMFVAGDEFGRTQLGSNNPYCQDNEISWLNWEMAETNKDLLRFFQHLIALRMNHPIFRRADFFPRSGLEPDLHEIHWQALQAGEPDWSPDCRTLGFMLDCLAVPDCGGDDFFIMLNSSLDPVPVEIPEPSPGRCWHLLADTGAQAPDDIYQEDEAPLFSGQQYDLMGMAALVLISKPCRD